MPGVIEDGDPGEGAARLNSIVVSSGEHSAAPLDIELLVDRPRFMGLDEGLVENAERRLRADAPSGMAWLADRLRALEWAWDHGALRTSAEFDGKHRLLATVEERAPQADLSQV